MPIRSSRPKSESVLLSPLVASAFAKARTLPAAEEKAEAELVPVLMASANLETAFAFESASLFLRNVDTERLEALHSGRVGAIYPFDVPITSYPLFL